MRRGFCTLVLSLIVLLIDGEIHVHSIVIFSEFPADSAKISQATLNNILGEAAINRGDVSTINRGPLFDFTKQGLKCTNIITYLDQI